MSPRLEKYVASPQYALLAKGTFHFTIYNVIFGKSKMADVRFAAFVTILLKQTSSFAPIHLL